MSANYESGSAFPVVITGPEKGFLSIDRGISIRDYFAGQALAGMLADVEVNDTAMETARRAYRFADAMLLAREQFDLSLPSEKKEPAP